MKEDIDLYDLKEIQAILGCSLQMLYNHISSGKLKATKIGRKRFVRKEDFEDYLNAGYGPGKRSRST